jgi:hypothetical protein
MKKVETVEVPSYKWVVEDLCPSCEAQCGLIEVSADTELPEPPLAGARMLFSRK